MTQLAPTDYESIEKVLRSALQESLEEDRKDRQQRFGQRPLAWLALAPAWTEKLAQACGFPLGSKPLPDFLREAEAAGLCTGETSVEPDGTRVQDFWMPQSTRSSILDELRRMEGGVSFLQQEAGEIGRRILKAQQGGVTVSAGLANWAQLAVRAEESLFTAGQWLIQQVFPLVKRNDTGEALAWVRMGTVLAQALGGKLNSAIQISNHQIELAYRHGVDERRLGHYLKRQGQIDDFLKLLEARDNTWALHYIGMGGIGKTMLLRYITARLAANPREELPSNAIPYDDLPTCRVDFDYLSPEYPIREPGRLLLMLADELRQYGFSDRHEFLFNELQSQCAKLHESLSSVSSGNPLAFLGLPAFENVVRTFAELVQLQSRPVILILDTCEELAKVSSAAMLPNVIATFGILERVHEVAPMVRVILAGRRLLAKSGYDWSVDEAIVTEAKSHLPEKKEYLRLHEIRGFDKDEAADYFAGIKGLTLTPEMRDAVLNRSEETGTAIAVRWDDGRVDDKKVRYNPFDLSLFADWLVADPSLKAGTISSGETDPYVQLRIIDRINRDDVRKVLPAVVLLRRFEKAMLRPALDLKDEAFQDLYRELGDQEWMDSQREERLETSFLEVDRKLYPRLQKYYQHPDRQKLLKDAEQSLGPSLAALVRERMDKSKLQHLGADHLDAALRTLLPDKGAALWDEIEQCIVSEGDWYWAENVAGRILGEDGAVGKIDHPLRSAVRATLTAALIQTSPAYDPASDWEEVAQRVESHPGPPILKEVLEARARLGKIAASRVAPAVPSDEVLSSLWRFADLELSLEGAAEEEMRARTGQLAAAQCAALERLLELGVTFRDSDFQNAEKWVRGLEREGVSNALLAFARTLAGRMAMAHGDWDSAMKWMLEAETAVAIGETPPQPQYWSDWRSPVSLRDRVRLELLHSLFHETSTQIEGQWMGWQQEAAKRLELIDAERLISSILMLRLARNPVPSEELQTLTQDERYDPDRQPVCEAHREVPPLFVTLALGWLALGEGDRALGRLNARVDQATKSGRDELSIRAGERAKLQVLRRMRMHQRERASATRSAESQVVEDLVLAWPALAVMTPPGLNLFGQPRQDWSLLTIHSWWRCQYMLKSEGARRALETMQQLGLNVGLSTRRQIIGNVGAKVLEAKLNLDRQARGTQTKEDAAVSELVSLMLDWKEAMLVADRVGIKLKEWPFRFDAMAWYRDHPDRSEEAVRLMLRMLVLQDHGNMESLPVDRVGARRIAEIALDEGELLAMRLPREAIRLLDMAHDWFVSAGDPAGATIAAIRSLIASIHAGEVTFAQEKLKRMVEPIYEQLRASPSGSGLPSWTELMALRDAPDMVSQLSRLNHPSWSGWLHRLFYGLVWSFERAGKRTTNVREWLKQVYGAELPVELSLWSADELERPEPAEMARVEATKSVTRRKTSQILFLLLGLGITVGFLIGGYDLFRLGLRWLAPSGLGTGWQIGLYVAILMLLGLLPKTYRALVLWIRSLMASRTAIHLSITPPPESPDKGWESDKVVPIRMQLRQRKLELGLAWPPIIRQPEAKVEGTGNTPGLRAYREASADVPPEIVKELGDLQQQLGRRPLPISLQIPSLLSPLPWEAVLTLTLLTPVKERFREIFQFWRSGTRIPKTFNPSEWRAGKIHVISSQNWRLLAEKGWQPLGREVAISDEIPGSKTPVTLKVLHLLGTPVRTGAGFRFQVSGGNQAGVTEKSMEKQSARSIWRAEGLIGADQLPLNSVSLVLVQAEPVDTVARGETDRKQAASLRAFAIDLLTAGAPRVLVLPALPSDLAEEVLRRLAKRLRSHSPPDIHRLLRTVSVIRRTIADWKFPHSEGSRDVLIDDLMELVLDVCLFTSQPPTGIVEGRSEDDQFKSR